MNKSEFGKVLEREGWEQSDLADYWDSPCGKWLAYPDTLDGEVALFDKKRFGVIAFATNEHHVLRIVASIEGTDRWRSVDSVPEGEIVQMFKKLPDNTFIVRVAAINSNNQVIDEDGTPLYTVDSDGIVHELRGYSYDGWRPYSEHNWEVSQFE